MPLIYVTASAGVFSNEARDELAKELMKIGMEAEQEPVTPFAESTNWTYFEVLIHRASTVAGRAAAPASFLWR